MHVVPPRSSAPLLRALTLSCALLGTGTACATAAEDDSRGVSAQTHGAGDAYAGAPPQTGEPIAPEKPLDNDVLRALTMMTSSPQTAVEGVRRLRGYLAQDLNPEYRGYLGRMLVRGLIVAGAPSEEIVAEAEKAAPGIPQAASTRAMFYLEVANAVSDRGDLPPGAVRLAEKAIGEIPPDESRLEVGALANSVLGTAQLRNGECSRAIETLQRAVGVTADSQRVLHTLGAAYEACDQPDAAIGHYVRALGVFGGDSLAAAPLRQLYAKRHGSLEGLDRMVAASADASAEQMLASRRYEKPMPEWRMEDTAGHIVRSQDLAGKILVLDFWGSWCGPCRVELPHFQAVYEKYRDQGVVFYGINWERADRSKRKAIAMAYLEEHGFDFPNVFDLDDKSPMTFEVQSFPTVFIVDHTGKIRYRNIGFTEGIGEIMSLQIESLIDEQKRAAAK